MKIDKFRPSLSNALKALGFLAGAMVVQGCFFGGGGHPYYAEPAYGPPSYAYASPAPAYGYAAPSPRIGDYDEHHSWHDRDWWVKNNHPWVTQHHPEWVAHEHEHEHH